MQMETAHGKDLNSIGTSNLPQNAVMASPLSSMYRLPYGQMYRRYDVQNQVSYVQKI